MVLCAGLFALAVLALPGRAWCDSGLLGVGAGALAMGGAVTGGPEGPPGIYWNPAAAVQAGRTEVSVAYGMLQRHDVGQRDFGNTEGFFIGGIWVPRTERVTKPYGILLAVEKPYPRLEYSAGRALIDPYGLPQTLTVSLRRDYIEVLAGGSYLLARWETLGGRWSLSCGLVSGVGLADDSWKGALTTGPTSAGFATNEAESLTKILPLGSGALLSFRIPDGPRFAAGISYRFLRDLSGAPPLRFESPSLELLPSEIGALFPSDEVRLGISAAFPPRWRASMEFQRLFIRGPSVFPRVLPERMSSLRLGLEHAVPIDGALKAVAVRAGASLSFLPSLPRDDPYMSEALGLYAGVGAALASGLRADFFVSYQKPVGSDVAGHVLAGLDMGWTF